MQITNFEEQKDGSATIQLDMTDEEKTILINIGFIAILKRSIDDFEKGFEKNE